MDSNSQTLISPGQQFYNQHIKSFNQSYQSWAQQQKQFAMDISDLVDEVFAEEMAARQLEDSQKHEENNHKHEENNNKHEDDISSNHKIKGKTKAQYVENNKQLKNVE